MEDRTRGAIELMNELPPAPDDVLDWIKKEVVRENYIFYDKKKGEMTCSRCGNRSKIQEEIKHKGKSHCTNCDSYGEYRNINYGKKNLTEYGRILIFVKKEETVYASLQKINMIFAGDGLILERTFNALYKFTAAEQTEYVNSNWIWGGNIWEKRKRIRIPHLTNPNVCNVNKYKQVFLYDRNINDVFKQTCLKYADLPNFITKYNLTPDVIIPYIALFLKYQSVEKMYKIGFQELLISKAKNHNTFGAINWRGKTLQKIFGLNMTQIKEVKKAGLGYAALEVYKKAVKANEPISAETAEIIAETYNLSAIEKSLENIISVGRAAEYLMKQNFKSKYSSKLSDYRDYIEECKKLKYDLKNRKVLRPKNFAEAHRKTAKLCANMKHAEDIQKVKANTLKITGMTGPYVKDDLMIIPADDPGIIKEEGVALHHCVAGYIDRVAKGDTAILAVRAAENPEEPYYTLELSKERKIVQCRGLLNKNATPEIQQFVDTWYRETIERKAR